MNELQLLDFYQRKVDALPVTRNTSKYPEEIAVDIISYLITNHCRNQGMSSLMYYCMQHTRGQVNPSIVEELIKEWKETC